ncbi:MAG TPA: hypothetical protein VNO17_08085 [Actinomycetota bacterium]|nr:hypothetical protein [Actinomycetota bacterium]
MKVTRPRGRGLALALATLTVLAGATAWTTAAPAAARRIDAQRFHDRMRKLWEDHVTWTRMVIVSVAHDLPDLDVAVARLLRNQADIGDAIRPFYGDEAADALTALLEEHITTAADVLAAAKAGDEAALQDALDRWYDNARRIGRFLHRANPEFWPREEMVSMMTEHLDLTLAEATARLSGDYAADVSAYDRVHRQALRMADMLSDGILAAFADRFAA